jgi:hypothetical protein
LAGLTSGVIARDIGWSPANLAKCGQAPDILAKRGILPQSHNRPSLLSVVMERSPSAFSGLDEEALRTHFQIPLNGKFQGMASGETFNAASKTDILIKHEDRILFVAECKFWKGAQSLTDAISQLLSYMTWRETKAAILLFNQNKNFSSVLDQIPGGLPNTRNLCGKSATRRQRGFVLSCDTPTTRADTSSSRSWRSTCRDNRLLKK